MRQIRLFALCLALGLSLSVPCLAGEPFRFPVGRDGDKGELQYINGLPVLVVSGSPEDMGTTTGKLCLGPARRVLDYPRDLLKLHKVELVYELFAQSGKGMIKQFPA